MKKRNRPFILFLCIMSLLMNSCASSDPAQTGETGQTPSGETTSPAAVETETLSTKGSL